jgi:hypothetical protein
MLMGIFAGDQCRKRWTAKGGWDISSTELGASIGDAVQAWCFNIRMTHEAEMIKTILGG